MALNRFLAAAGLVLAMVCTAIAQDKTGAPALAVKFDDQGLSSLAWDGREMLVRQPFAASFAFRKADQKPTAPKPAKPIKVEGTGQGITRTYEGATVTCNYRVEGNRLFMGIDIRNDSPDVLYQASIVPFRTEFPRRPKGRSWRWGYSVTASGYGEPAVVVADYTEGLVAACNEDPDNAVNFGFSGNNRNGLANDVCVQTLGGQVYDEMPISPGATASFHFSFRFAAAGTPLDALAGDVYRAYAAKYPPMLKWPDNRPVGGLFLARDNTKWEKNPRGFFNDEKLDVASPQGKEKFRQRLLAYADTAIKVIKENNGQGMITWDIEGAEFPHATTYLGDPRILSQAAPEMDAVADEYFKKFRDAGLRTGICIRPTTIVAADPVKYPYIKSRLGHFNGVDPVENICDKIAYAKKRWGCTLFYMDTPGLYRTRYGKTEYYQLPTHVLRAICKRHPDVLITPEFGPNGYFAVASRYGELGGSYRTGDAPRLAYPGAFTLFSIKDDPMYPHWDQLVQGVGNGDVLLFRGWFGDMLNQRCKQAWLEAEYRKKTLTPRIAKAAGNENDLIAALADPDAATRYQAAMALGKAKSAAASGPLILALQKDPEWIVRRVAAEALGNIGGAEVIAALATVVNTPKSDLQYFAALALGSCGSPAIPELTKALDGTDAQRWEAAAAALVRLQDPSATSALQKILSEKGRHAGLAKITVLTALRARPDQALFDSITPLLADSPGNLRTEVAKTLGAYKDERAIEPLIALLDSKNSDLYYAKKEAMFALEDITGRDGTVKGRTGGGENAAAWRKILGK